jgi:hypothetical protein
MKSIATKSLAVVALVAAMGVSIPAAAFADSTTTSTSTSTTASASTPWTTWRATWVTYVQGLKSINSTFHTAVQTARATLQSALAAATDKTDRQAAISAFEASVEAALNARVTAITAAGDPPPPPTGYNGTAYVDGIQAANVAFRATVTTAQSTLSAALAAATTGQEAKTAHLTYEQTVGTAVATRAAALLALGSPPSNPGQPS